MLKLIVKKAYIKPIIDFFEVYPNRSKGFINLKHLKSFLIRNNYESINRTYYKLIKGYNYPIWINAATVSTFSKDNYSKYSKIYYLYLKNSSNNCLNFLGVCFYTPANDLVFSLHYKKILGKLKVMDLTSLESVLKPALKKNYKIAK